MRLILANSLSLACPRLLNIKRCENILVMKSECSIAKTTQLDSILLSPAGPDQEGKLWNRLIP